MLSSQPIRNLPADQMRALSSNCAFTLHGRCLPFAPAVVNLFQCLGFTLKAEDGRSVRRVSIADRCTLCRLRCLIGRESDKRVDWVGLMVGLIVVPGKDPLAWLRVST